MNQPESVVERPEVSAPEPWSFPEPQRAGLANGLGVVSYDIPGQYVISVRLAVPMPLEREPRELEGIHEGTAMTATMTDTAASGSSGRDPIVDRPIISADCREAIRYDAHPHRSLRICLKYIRHPSLTIYAIAIIKQCSHPANHVKSDGATEHETHRCRRGSVTCFRLSTLCLIFAR